MDAKTIAAMAADPAEFRRHLLIDADGAAVPFRPDPWQEEAFRAVDPAWRAIAGRGPADGVRLRSWDERPRGHAKTSDEAVSIVWALLFAARPIKGVAAAGDQDQAKLLRQAIQTLARLNPWIGDLLGIQANRVVNTRTGSELVIISSDAATSYGLLGIDFIVCDEVTHWQENRGESLWISLLSAAAKRKACLLQVICNAGFTESWQWRTREAIRTDPQWIFHRLDGPVASWITPDRLAEQERLLPASAYARLWLNQWSSSAGDAIAEDDITAAIRREGPLIEPEPGWWYFGGLDLGVSRDSAAFAIVGKHGSGKLRLALIRSWKPGVLANLFGKKQVDLIAVEQGIRRANQNFHLKLLGYDAYQAVQMTQQLGASVRCEAVPFHGKPSQEMASALVEAFTGRQLEIYPDPALVDDLKRMRIVERPTFWKLEPQRTSSGHGDRAVALALALWAARKTTVPTRRFFLYGEEDFRESQRQEPGAFDPTLTAWNAYIDAENAKADAKHAEAVARWLREEDDF